MVAKLGNDGHDVLPASPTTGVDAVTCRGLAEVLEGADVVVDVTNSPSFEPDAILSFFETSTRNLLAAEEVAGVRHHVALSVVGTHLLTESGYFRGKIAQENLMARVAIGDPVNGTIELAGPDQFRLDELIRTSATARNDPRIVVADPAARYFGALLSERALVPGEGATFGETRFEEWLELALATESPI